MGPATGGARFPSLPGMERPASIALSHLLVRLEEGAPGKIGQVRHYYEDILLLLPGMPDTVYEDQETRPGKPE